MKNQVIYQSPDQYQIMLDNYASIVEKTNQQLGLWSNPYGIMIGILGVTITIIGIVTAYYLWKNSKEQKDLFANVILSQKKYLEEQYNILTEQKKNEIDKVIKDFENIKNSISEDKKAEFDRIIDEYRVEKEKIKPVSGFMDYSNNLNMFSHCSTSVLSSDIYPWQSSRSMKCTNCGKSFNYIAENSITAVSLIPKRVYCSHCGALNIAQ